MSKSPFFVFSFFVLNVFNIHASETSSLSQEHLSAQRDIPSLFKLDDDYGRRVKHGRTESPGQLIREPNFYKKAQGAERPISETEIDHAKKVFFGQHKKLITAFYKSCKQEAKQESVFVFPVGSDICVSYNCTVSLGNQLSLKKTYTDEQLNQWGRQLLDQEMMSTLDAFQDSLCSGDPLDKSFKGMSVSKR